MQRATFVRSVTRTQHHSIGRSDRGASRSARTLPGDPRREIFDDHSVVGPCRRSILVDPRSAATTSAVTTAWAPSMFHGNPFSEEFSAVEVVYGIVGIAVVVKFAESVFSVLDEDVVDPPVFVEEPLDVSLPGVVRQVAQEHASGVAVVIS